MPVAFLQHVFARRIPSLGICYGHQMLCHLAGGRVIPNPEGVESGDVELEVLAGAGEFPLFSGLGERFKVFMKHHDVVEAVPDGWTNHARTRLTGVVATWLQPLPVFGLQFHPEMSRAKVRAPVFANFFQFAGIGKDTA